LTISAMSAQTPGMTGVWQMNADKSQVLDGRTVTLVIETVASQLKLRSTVRDRAGHEVTTEFTCGVDGKDCEFDEGGHRSKVSMWYNGPALLVCKTNGPVGDVVNEWKLELAPNGKALTLTITHVEPSASEEVVAFTKKPS
jgi:hypothetical protein